jgi:hypothetical protein
MQSREVRVHEKFYQPVNITSSSTAANLGTLDFGSLFSASTNLLNLGDMFRLFRINKAKFLLRWEEGPSLTQYHFPSSVLYILPFDAAAPTSLANLEQALAVGPLHPSRIMHATELTHNGTGGAADPTLSVQHSDLVVIDSASPSGWLATSADGGQTSFGTLYRLTYAAGSSAPTAAPGWNWKLTLTSVSATWWIVPYCRIERSHVPLLPLQRQSRMCLSVYQTLRLCQKLSKASAIWLLVKQEPAPTHNVVKIVVRPQTIGGPARPDASEDLNGLRLRV